MLDFAKPRSIKLRRERPFISNDRTSLNDKLCSTLIPMPVIDVTERVGAGRGPRRKRPVKYGMHASAAGSARGS